MDWEARSGSLKERRCLEPEAMAAEAALCQLLVWPDCVPQSMGTYSKALERPGVDEAQL